ncbi:hypothetical protein D1872_310860 [compost metagenome]
MVTVPDSALPESELVGFLPVLPSLLHAVIRMVDMHKVKIKDFVFLAMLVPPMK